jgi:hypothetical protein
MSNPTLADSIFNFARVAESIADADLDRPWAWKDYDSEGVRFAFFRTFEDLRTLATKIAQSRLMLGRPRSAAQLILGNYHLAFRDLQAVLLGKDNESFGQPPSAGEWPVRRAFAHIIGADMGFYVAIKYTLDGHREADGRPAKIPDEAWDTLLEMDEEAQDRLMNSNYDDLKVYHDTFHNKVLTDFATITADELALPSYYWEKEPFGLRFRLHRFESHMRQHTVQIEKTLAMQGQHTTEAQRLLRLVFAALAEVEAFTIGSSDLETSQQQATAQMNQQRTEEVVAALRA